MVAAAPAQPKPTLAPQPGPQSSMLSSKADIVLFGGAAYGGKSWSLLFEPLRHVNNSRFRAILFRRSEPILKQAGGLIDESKKMYPMFGAVYNVAEMFWSFPSGAQIQFRHLQHFKHLEDHRGGQYAYIGFDELTEFEKDMFFFMLSRNRSDSGVKGYTRASCNPDADSWVRDLVDWWIDENGFAIPERSGVVRWLYRNPSTDEFVWGETRQQVIDQFPHLKGTLDEPVPKSFTFIPAMMADNVIGMRINPDYRGSLQLQNIVERERLMKGNWNIKHEAGTNYHMEMWGIVPESQIPLGGVACRGFDFAATKRDLRKKVSGRNDPDYTAGHLMLYTDGRYYSWDAVALQLGPTDVDNLFIATIKEDLLWAKQRRVTYKVRWEQAPGDAGIKESIRLVTLILARCKRELRAYGKGLDAAGVPSRMDKLSRMQTFGSILRMPGHHINLRQDDTWNKRYLTHMHHQFDWPHDDEHDATGVSFNGILEGRKRKPRMAVGGSRALSAQMPVGMGGRK